MSNTPLHSGSESIHVFRAFLGMFGRPALHSRSPHFEGASLHISAHELNGLTFTYAKLRRDGIKWRAVFPCHFDNTG